MSPHQDWIHNLLDGELDSMNESALFGEFAVNADLRTEFKQQLAIRSAVHQDRVGLVPPIALTNTLFGGLGFAAPLAGAAAGVVSGGLLIQWLTRLGLPLLSTIAAAGITFGLTQNSGQYTATEQQPVYNPITGVTTSSASSITNDREGERLRREVSSLRAERNRLNALLAGAPVTAPDPQPQSESAQFEMPSVSTSNIALTNSIALTHSMEPRMLQVLGLEPVVLRSTLFPSFLVQVRGVSGSPLSDVNVPAQTSWYDNMSIGLLYQLSHRDAVGMEFGNEAYAMSFEGERDGQIVRYEQQPSSMWAGITYRHTLKTIGKTAFAPFGQILLGGTKFGPLGRLSAGITYAPSGPLSFIFGVEGSTMAYQFQDTWFGSSKIGLTYGVAVRF